MVKVLIVDDEKPILFLLSAIIGSIPGIAIVEAHDGTEAVGKAKEENPDIMVLDNSMPGMSGVDVCRVIKADPALAHIRIMILSCQGHNFDWALAHQSGAEAYLTKPFNTGVLIGKVKELIKPKK